MVTRFPLRVVLAVLATVAAVVLLGFANGCTGSRRQANPGSLDGPTETPSAQVSDTGEPSASPSPSTSLSPSVPPSPSVPASPTPSRNPTPTGSPPRPNPVPRLVGPVRVERAGGIVGGTQVVMIQPTGAWTVQEVSGGRRTGTLPPTRRTELARLLTLNLGGQPSPGGGCHDGFRYAVRYQRVAASAGGCERAARPVLFAVLDLVGTATGTT